MSDEMDQIKAGLNSALGKIDKVKTDVSNLHAKIDALPNSEELAEVKALSGQLNASLQEVDDMTEDNVEGNATDGEGTPA